MKELVNEEERVKEDEPVKPQESPKSTQVWRKKEVHSSGSSSLSPSETFYQ